MTLEELVATLKNRHAGFSPQLRKIARFVLDNPGQVGVSSLRDLADQAGVKPNSLVRLAKVLEFDTYEEFRKPFRDAARHDIESYPERARWLQELGRGNGGDDLFAQMTGALFSNVSFIFQTIDPHVLRSVAREAVAAKNFHIMGLGSCYPPLLSFYYVGRMALRNMRMLTTQGGYLLDDLVEIGPEDVILVASYRPYRQETVDAVEHAKARGAKVIAITDGHSSPVAADPSRTLIAPSTSPQIFPSTLALSAVLEILLAFIVSEAGPDTISRIEAFHRQRIERDLYFDK